MKLTVKQLIVGSDALKRLGEKGVKILPYKIFYAVGKNIGHIDKEIDHYNKDYQRIVSEFSAEQPDGTFGVAPKDVRVLNKVIEDAQAVEVDIPIMTLTLTEEIIEKAEIHAADLAALDWMFVLPEEKE
jgi:hypothetical protein